MGQIQKHLRIEEETRNRDKMSFLQTGPKVNYIDGAHKRNFFGGKKRKFNDTSDPPTNAKKKNLACYHCGKKGHLKRECRYRKKLKREEVNKANMVEDITEEIVAMVSDMHISMVTELNMAGSNKSLD